jgi:sulfate transport system ATP-binding protein
MVQDSKAFAYVRPHDLDVQRYVAGVSAADQPRGIVAKLTRAMVIGPIARLELLPLDASAAGSGEIIEAQIPAQHYRELDFKEGDTLVLTPRKARVFVP